MVRTAVTADAPAVAAIWNPVIRDTEITFNTVEKTPEDLAGLFAERQAAGHAFLVAEKRGRILGFAAYSQFRGGVGYARTMEHTVILAPDHRGRGIGRTLVSAVEDHARAGGAHSMFAGVSSGNPDGVAFHGALGYVEVARLRQVGWKFGKFFDLCLMQKFL
ncbi:MAG: GNAT family N-acetyltransferase [Rhodobacter sp.]|nr:GNAT family N-acetyltransferase [Rhodobacter sp.]